MADIRSEAVAMIRLHDRQVHNPSIASIDARVVRVAQFARVAFELLESAEFELDWLTLHHVIEQEGADWKSKFDGSAFYECDCSESGGYMEYDTNAYIHTEQCASGHEDSLAALHDQIRQALGKSR